MGHTRPLAKETEMVESAGGLIVIGTALAGAAIAVLRVFDRRTPPSRDPLKRSQFLGRVIDDEPHLLIHLTPSGRLIPGKCETFSDYGLAVSRQRDLARDGFHAVVLHQTTGEMRLDLDGVEQPRRSLI